MTDILNAAAANAARQRDKEEKQGFKQLQKEMEKQRQQGEKLMEKQRQQGEKLMEKQRQEQERERQREGKEQAKAELKRAKEEQREAELRTTKVEQKELQKQLKNEQQKSKPIKAALALKAPDGSKTAGVVKKQKSLNPDAAGTGAATGAGMKQQFVNPAAAAGAAAAARAAAAQKARGESRMHPAQKVQESKNDSERSSISQTVVIIDSDDNDNNDVVRNADTTRRLYHNGTSHTVADAELHCEGKSGGGTKKTKEERHGEKEEKQQRQAEVQRCKMLEKERREQERERVRRDKERAKHAKAELKRAEKEQKELHKKFKTEQKNKYMSRANCLTSCHAGGRPKCICGRTRLDKVVGPGLPDEQGIPHQVAESFEMNELKLGLAPTPHMRKLLMKSNQGTQILQDIATYGEYGKYHDYSVPPEDDSDDAASDYSDDAESYDSENAESDNSDHAEASDVAHHIMPGVCVSFHFGGFHF